MVREGGTVREQLVNSFPRTYFQVTVISGQRHQGGKRREIAFTPRDTPIHRIPV